jgi:hypothetical protein
MGYLQYCDACSKTHMFSDGSMMQIARCVDAVHKAREVLFGIRLEGGRLMDHVVIRQLSTFALRQRMQTCNKGIECLKVE